MKLQRLLEIMRSALVFTLSGFELRTDFLFMPKPHFAKKRDYVIARKEFKKVKSSQKSAIKRSGTREGKVIINKKQKL